MADNKTIVIKKEDLDQNTKAKSLKEKEEKSVKEKTIVSDEETNKEVEPLSAEVTEETVDEHIFKNTKKTDTFAEKSAQAAANAALKAAIEANSEIAIKEAEKVYFIEKKKHMLERCKKDKKVPVTISKFYAPYIGKVYTFNYNGIPVTIYCDGQPHEYPEFIANKINKKMAKIADSNTYKEITDNLSEEK